MATSIIDGPYIQLPPIPDYCFSPVVTTTGASSVITAILPESTECAPWAALGGYPLSSAYSTRGICPSGWLHDDTWRMERDYSTQKVCCPSGFSPAHDDISTTFTVTGTTTLDVGSSAFSTEFTAVLRTSWSSGTCYSTLTAPAVLQLAASSGEQPSGSVTIASDMLVSASYMRISSLSADPSAPAASSRSTPPSSRGSASPSRSGPTSGVLRASSSPIPGDTSSSGGSSSPQSDDPTFTLASGAEGTGRPTQSRGLGQAGTIGIAVGATVVVMALLFGAFIIYSRRKRRQRRLQQPIVPPEPYTGYPELETRPVQTESYVMLDSGTKFELAADHSWKAVEADSRRHDAAYTFK